MKQAVIKRLLKQEDSTLNRQFEDFAGFYGFQPILCRPYRGQTKGKVERTVQFVRDNFMTGIKYNRLADLNGQAWPGPPGAPLLALRPIHLLQQGQRQGTKRLPHLVRRQSVLRARGVHRQRCGSRGPRQYVSSLLYLCGRSEIQTETGL